MSIYLPYTYLIGWSKINQWYYGSRTAKKSKCLYESGCHPDDFFETYFTSSEKVKEMIEEFGTPDVIQIRKTFEDDPESALRWEARVLKRLKVVLKKKWINGSYMSGVPNSWAGKTEEEYIKHCENISRGRKGMVFSDEHRKNLAKWDRFDRDKSYLTDGWKKQQSINQTEIWEKRRKGELPKMEMPVCSCFSCEKVMRTNQLKRHFRHHHPQPTEIQIQRRF